MKRVRDAARVMVGRADLPASGDSPTRIEAADGAFWPLAEQAKPYTMTSDERMYTLFSAIKHVVRAGVPGDFVECGVWRGGSSMLAALTFLQLGDTRRTIHLYDTFEGMPPPGGQDVDRFGVPAGSVLDGYSREPGANNPWAYATLDDVRNNMDLTGYPNVRLVEGKVEETIPAEAPERISVLRLDTDWYESTRHELIHLYPRLQRGGILILDDYGWWDGARQAVDEYFADDPLFLARVDDEGARVAVKP